jgi:hypothetical protein
MISQKDPTHQTLTKWFSPMTKLAIMVDSSIEEISEVLNKMESDNPPVESQADQAPIIQQEAQIKPSYFKHRFAIYKTNIPSFCNTKILTQLQFFKSFIKCFKSIDNQIQFLPIQNDRKVNPLSQLSPWMKITPKISSKHTNTTTLSGDFYLGTKHTFKELISHKDLVSCFIMHSYNITLNGCQKTDMVRIGFLTRVKGFAYRDDLKSNIINSNKWKESPFHFRLYFDCFSTNSKGKMSYVTMIDVDHPNIEQGMKFFLEFFDGDLQNSPNSISYMFIPLYRKA